MDFACQDSSRAWRKDHAGASVAVRASIRIESKTKALAVQRLLVSKEDQDTQSGMTGHTHRNKAGNHYRDTRNRSRYCQTVG